MQKRSAIRALYAVSVAFVLIFVSVTASASEPEYGEFPQSDAWTQAVPSVVWAADTSSTTTLSVHIVKRKDVKRVWLTNLGSNEPEGRMELFDYGTHGDRKAKDRIFTRSDVVLNKDVSLSGRISEMGYSSWVGFLRVELQNGTLLGHNYGMIVGLADLKYKGFFPVRDFGNGLSSTPWAFFIEDIDHRVIDSYPVANVVCGTRNYNAFNKLYSIYPDAFDFAVLMPGMQLFRPKGLAENVPYSVLVSNKVKHIGMPLTDKTKFFGSAGRLMSVQYNSFSSIQIQDHEVGHSWGIALGKKLGLMDETWSIDLGHWNKMSDVQGQMGAYYFNGESIGHFAWNGDGTWRLVSNYDVEPYSPLELYLMGLIPSSEVPDVHILRSPDLSDPQRITAKSYKTITMEQIVKNAGGERIPSVSESQKAFRLAFIVTQDLPYNDAAYAYFSLMSQELAGKQSPSMCSMLAPFYWATGGRATLDTFLGGLDTLIPVI